MLKSSYLAILMTLAALAVAVLIHQSSTTASGGSSSGGDNPLIPLAHVDSLPLGIGDLAPVDGKELAMSQDIQLPANYQHYDELVIVLNRQTAPIRWPTGFLHGEKWGPRTEAEVTTLREAFTVNDTDQLAAAGWNPAIRELCPTDLDICFYWNQATRTLTFENLYGGMPSDRAEFEHTTCVVTNTPWNQALKDWIDAWVDDGGNNTGWEPDNIEDAIDTYYFDYYGRAITANSTKYVLQCLVNLPAIWDIKAKALNPPSGFEDLPTFTVPEGQRLPASDLSKITHREVLYAALTID